MADQETLNVYDEKVSDYAEMTKREEIDPDLLRFMAALPIGGSVLDLGCGPGMASAIMRDRGFKPDAVDGSSAMVASANLTYDLGARVATFDSIDMKAVYDGVWANFSLLHARREEMSGHLAAVHKALKAGGAFHIGMKIGEAEERDNIGRFYTYYRHEELNGLLEKAGFKILDYSKGEEAGLSGVVAPFVTILAKRQG